MAESFVVEVSSHAAELARHRASRVVEPKDIQLYLGMPLGFPSSRADRPPVLEREYDLGLPGFVDGEERTALRRMPHPTVGHQTRAAHAARAASTAASHPPAAAYRPPGAPHHP